MEKGDPAKRPSVKPSGGAEFTHLQKFHHRGANFRISSNCYDAVCAAIVRFRMQLQQFVETHQLFHDSLTPVDIETDAPEIALRMARAAAAVGVGPMAAVAGTVAQLAAMAAREKGFSELIVENGGDLFLYSQSELNIGLYAGDSPLGDKLALKIPPCDKGVAICSSSSKMGHSLSLGDCDLATVVSPDASLADAAATQAANLVKKTADIDAVLKKIEKIPGISGLVIIKDDRIGIAGNPGEIVANKDVALVGKVTKDPSLDK